MGFKMLAEQQLATTTIEAFSTEFGVVGTDSFANLEAFYILAHRRDDANCFMAGDEGKFGQKLALVDM